MLSSGCHFSTFHIFFWLIPHSPAPSAQTAARGGHRWWIALRNFSFCELKSPKLNSLCLAALLQECALLLLQETLGCYCSSMAVTARQSYYWKQCCTLFWLWSSKKLMSYLNCSWKTFTSTHTKKYISIYIRHFTITLGGKSSDSENIWYGSVTVIISLVWNINQYFMYIYIYTAQ